MNYPPGTIPLPSYLLQDDDLTGLLAQLEPFAVGDPDHTDDGPCDRAIAAKCAIVKELEKRGRPITLDGDK